jgi:hypothetical protein
MPINRGNMSRQTERPPMKKPVTKKMGGGLMARPAAQTAMAQRAGSPMNKVQPMPARPAPRPMAMKKGGKTRGCK